MNKQFLFFATLLFQLAVFPLAAQIQGVIVDETGEPVIGASVLEKGTTNGTITDFDGNFMLQVSDGAMLEIS